MNSNHGGVSVIRRLRPRLLGCWKLHHTAAAAAYDSRIRFFCGGSTRVKSKAKVEGRSLDPSHEAHFTSKQYTV